MERKKIIWHCRGALIAVIGLIMDRNGHNLEDAESILREALNIAMNEIKNEFYK